MGGYEPHTALYPYPITYMGVMGPTQPYIHTPYPIWGSCDPHSPISPPHILYWGHVTHAALYPYPIAYMRDYELTQPYNPTP